MQPSTTARQPAGVRAAAAAMAAAVAAPSPASMASARPGQATWVTRAPAAKLAMSLRWYSLAVVATVAQMASEQHAAAAGLIAGTVPTTGIRGSSSARSTSRACTVPVLQAMIITSGRYLAAALAQARQRCAMSLGLRGPHGIPSGSMASTRSASGRSRSSSAAAASSPSPESISAIRMRTTVGAAPSHACRAAGHSRACRGGRTGAKRPPQ